MIPRMIEKHGKQFVKTLIDIMMIDRKVPNDVLRDILIEYGVIKPSTKIIIGGFRRYEQMKYIEGSWRKSGDYENSLTIQNGRGQRLINLQFNDSQIQEILELLK